MSPSRPPPPSYRLIHGQRGAMGHRFEQNMCCRLCGRSYEDHQRRPRSCPRADTPKKADRGSQSLLGRLGWASG